MTEQVKLSSVVTLRGRFHRSVQIVQDISDSHLRESYLVTPTVRKIARKMIAGLMDPIGSRAWSLIGPYGTGKSSFAMYLIDVLSGSRPGPDVNPHQEDFTRPRLLPVVVTGERGPLRPALLQALARAMVPIDSKLVEQISSILSSNEIADARVLESFEHALQIIQQVRPEYKGLSLVLDEFGKFLEFAAHNPEREDLFILQSLAELAARSRGRMLLLTILHSALTDYLQDTDEVRQAEWQKVQGRFQEQSFVESHEQLLMIISQAIVGNFPFGIKQRYEQVIREAIDVEGMKEAAGRYSLSELLPQLIPLHPLTALLLPGLFKSKLAQNERSLFSFLSSHEPEGFLDFLEHTHVSIESASPAFYRVDRLYDYVRSSLGAATYRGENSRRWAEIEQALDRVGRAAPSLACAVLKAVGLLSIHGGSSGLRAHPSLLRMAFEDDRAVDAAIKYLEEQSIIVYRRHEGGYGLWEGSDVDLERVYRDARDSISKSEQAERLRKHLQLSPLVARAHYFQTGTLRAFEICVLDGSEEMLRQQFEQYKPSVEGCIFFILAKNSRQVEQLVATAEGLTNEADGLRRLRIVAIPKPMKGLAEALLEVETWRHVEQNTPSLKGDPVARREVHARLAHAQGHLENLAGETLGLRGYHFRPSNSVWIHEGRRHSLSAGQAFMSWLSDVCSKVYDKAPKLQNELINRNALSSAVVAARNTLLKKMLSSSRKHRLAIEGTPPEVSIYESVLARSGIHVQEGEHYSFAAPKESSSDGSWWPVWKAMEDFLVSTHTGRRPISELYSLLREPPYGLKEGPLPILLMALLNTHGSELALYKDGMFIPELGESHLELLARNPRDFEIQRFSFGRTEQVTLLAIRQALGEAGLPSRAHALELATIARDLITPIARLNVYTRSTRRLSRQAQSVRDLLLSAKEPLKLLLSDLPAVLTGSDEVRALHSSDELTKLLVESLTELQRAYPLLLDDIERQIRDAFQLTGDYREAREQLRGRYRHLLQFKSETQLAAFIGEVTRSSNQDWRESLGRVIHRGIPPSSWQDHDVVQFTHRLDVLVSDLTRLEELAAEKKMTPTAKVFRLGFLGGGLEEARAVIAVSPEMEAEVNTLKQKAAALLNEGSYSGPEMRRQIQLAALAELAAELMQQTEVQ